MASRTPLPGGAFLIREASPGASLTPEQLGAETGLLARAAADFLSLHDAGDDHAAVPLAEQLEEAGALSLLGLELPEEQGGLALGAGSAARILEGLAADPAFAAAHHAQTLVSLLAASSATPLPGPAADLGAGRLLAAAPLAPPRRPGVFAHPGEEAETLCLEGVQEQTVGAVGADLLLVWTDAGPWGSPRSAYLIDATGPGVAVEPETPLGLAGAGIGRVRLSRAIVPASRRICPPEVVIAATAAGRFRLAAVAVGRCKHLLALLASALRTTPDRAPLNAREALAAATAGLFALESAVYRVAGLLETLADPLAAAEEYAIECAVLAIASADLLTETAEALLRTVGPDRWQEPLPALSAWRDARALAHLSDGAVQARKDLAHLLFERLDSGRIGLDIQHATADPATAGTFGAAQVFRSALLDALNGARRCFARPLDHPEFASALADMVVAVFGAELTALRVSALAAGNAPAGQRTPAETAGLLVEHATAVCLRDRGALVLGACLDTGWDAGESGVLALDDLMVRRAGLCRSLAGAVVRAKGYVWGA